MKRWKEPPGSKSSLATILEIKLGKARDDVGPGTGFPISLVRLCGVQESYQQRFWEALQWSEKYSVM